MFLERFRWSILYCCIALLIACGEGRATCGQSTAPAAQDNFQRLAESATAAREAGRADQAIHDYTRAVALRPGWAEGWWYLGTMQYDRDHYSEAIPALRKLVQLSPDLGAAWSFLGLSEFETKDYANSLADLQKAQSLGTGDDPELGRVSAYHLALLLNRSGEFEQASALLISTSGKNQSSPQIKSALGLALLRVPLLPEEIDPSQDALIDAAGEAASIQPQSPTQSLDALHALVNEHPKTPWLHYAYGLGLAEAGQTSEALTEQQKEAAISPQSALPQIQISALELNLRQPQQALDAARNAVALAPDSSIAHQRLAKALEAAGRNQEAIEQARTAANLAPEKSYVDPRLASLYGTSSGEGANATASVTDNAASWNQAMADYSAGHYPETIAALKTWVERKSGDGTAWAVMGLSEFELKDYDNALIHLQRGQQLGVGASPQAIQLAKYHLAILLNRKGQFENATELLAPLAGQEPLSNKIQFALGMALLRIPSLPDEVNASRHSLIQTSGEIAELLLASKYDQAFPKLQKLIEQYPATPFLHYANGIALNSLSQYDEAKTQMRAEIQISPQSALPWTRLASIALRQHLAAEALLVAQKAVQLAPDSADAHYVLGRTWAELSDIAKAIHELEVASQLNPDSPEIHFALARVYVRANQPEKASQERATFARLNALAEQQRAQHGDQSHQGSHDAASPSILSPGTSTPDAAQPQ
jgi:tetratricopeptide (TPR) repeat protein